MTDPQISEAADAYEAALVSAYQILNLSSSHRAAVQSNIAKCGAKPIFFEFQFLGGEIRLYRDSLGRKIEIEARTTGSTFHKEGITVSVTRASGGGDLVTALAQARLQMEMVQKAAQAEYILNVAHGSLRRRRSGIDNFKEAVFAELERRFNEALEAYKAVVMPVSL